MDTWDAVRARRNVREFGRQPVSEEDLDRILEAGRRSPSSRNWQPWDFVVVSDRDRLERLTGVWKGAWHVANCAAAIAVIAPEPSSDKETRTLHFDLGQAIITMMIVAADGGIGTCHAAVADQELARQILGFADDHFCAHIISVGYPAERPLRPIANPDRRPFSEVVHRETW